MTDNKHIYKAGVNKNGSILYFARAMVKEGDESPLDGKWALRNCRKVSKWG